MNRAALVFVFMLTLLFCSVIPAMTGGESATNPFGKSPPYPQISIDADGSISPSNASISQSGNVYTLTADIANEINVYCSNIVIDGAGYSLEPITGWTTTGIALTGVNNVIIKDISTTAGYEMGISLSYCSNCQIIDSKFENEGEGVNLFNSTNNNISANNIQNSLDCGIFLCASNNNSVSQNNFEWNEILNRQIFGYENQGINLDCSQYNQIFENNFKDNSEGVDINLAPFGYSQIPMPMDNVIYLNNFINNTKNVNFQLGIAANYTPMHPVFDSPYPNFWDNGKVGNYWSNNTGAAGKPFVVFGSNNVDNHPLSQPVNIQSPDESSSQDSFASPLTIAIVIITAVVASLVICLFLIKRHKAKSSQIAVTTSKS